MCTFFIIKMSLKWYKYCYLFHFLQTKVCPFYVVVDLLFVVISIVCGGSVFGACFVIQ